MDENKIQLHQDSGEGILERSIVEDEEAMNCIDNETVVVETSEYTTEETDPETANIMVVTHTTYTEVSFYCINFDFNFLSLIFFKAGI